MEKDAMEANQRKLFSLIMGRAEISRMGTLLPDAKAEEIAASLEDAGDYKQSKYLSMFLGVRARVMDEVAERFLAAHPNCVVLHLGCGLDSRCLRLKGRPKQWYDLDFPEVIALRRRYYSESETYHMLAADASELSWLDAVADGGDALIIAEGFSMFLDADENLSLFAAFFEKFDYAEYLLDVYTDRSVVYASSGSGGEVQRGRTILWGLENPRMLERISGVKFLHAYNFNYIRMIRSFPLPVQLCYRMIYGKKATNRLYRIYHYRITANRQEDA